jgi:D-glycero-D-manno-heptose 1,7-bisphosphate phosphatase
VAEELKARRAIFLDRDGTLIEERDYLSQPEQVALIPGSAEALRQAQDRGWKLIMITNQSGVGRGYFTIDDVHRVHEKLRGDLRQAGVTLDAIYIAPEAPGQPSRGRKPSPQFLFDARDEHGIVLEESFMIGDKAVDLECGWSAGVKGAFLVRTGYGRKVEATLDPQKGRATVVDDLRAAIETILRDSGDNS